MHSQLGFQLHQSHSLTVTGLKGGKKSKYWVSVGLLEISMWLSNYSFRLKICYILRLHIEYVSNKVSNFSDLPLPSYRAKYVKNVLKGSLRWVFKVLIHRLNVYLKP